MSYRLVHFMNTKGKIPVWANKYVTPIHEYKNGFHKKLNFIEPFTFVDSLKDDNFKSLNLKKINLK